MLLLFYVFIVKQHQRRESRRGTFHCLDTYSELPFDLIKRSLLKASPCFKYFPCCEEISSLVSPREQGGKGSGCIQGILTHILSWLFLRRMDKGQQVLKNLGP